MQLGEWGGISPQTSWERGGSPQRQLGEGGGSPHIQLGEDNKNASLLVELDVRGGVHDALAVQQYHGGWVGAPVGGEWGGPDEVSFSTRSLLHHPPGPANVYFLCASPRMRRQAVEQ